MSTTASCPHCGKALVLSAPRHREAPAMNGLEGITFKGRFGLSEREADCADLAIRGARSAEIAERMGYANAQVVRNTMTKVFDRIGVRNRTELLIVGVFGRRGLEVGEGRLCSA